jgi:hypothetical protein
MAEKGESPQFSISLPVEALEMIEGGLIPYGLYGKRRATICRELILRMLTTAEVKGNAQEGREKAARMARSRAALRHPARRRIAYWRAGGRQG